MSSLDPIDQLKLVRPDVPEVDALVRARARSNLGATPDPPERWQTRRRPIYLVAAALSLSCLLVVGLALRPGNNSDEAMAAAVARLADVAEHQRQINANGKNQWVVSYYRTRTTWTQTLTQEKLDDLTRNRVEMIDLRNAGGMGRIVYSKKLSPAEIREQKREVKRLQDRTDANIRAGVKLSELPSREVTATINANNVAYRDRAGAGGAGGLRRGSDYRVTFQNDAQARSAKILERAGIGGAAGNPSMGSGYVDSIGPTFGAPQPAIAKSLSSEPTELLGQLRRLEPYGLTPPGIKAKTDSDVFATAAAVVGSPYTPPKVRAAVIRLAGNMPGVVAAPATDLRGRPGLGLTQPFPGGTKRLIFDESDARLLGMDVEITDPSKFGGSHWAGPGKSRVRVLPLFDGGSISTSYDPWIVTRGRPVCRHTFCARKLRPIENP